MTDHDYFPAILERLLYFQNRARPVKNGSVLIYSSLSKMHLMTVIKPQLVFHFRFILRPVLIGHDLKRRSVVV